MNRIFLNFGFFTITWYALFIVLGMIIGSIIVLNNKKVQQIMNNDEIYDYFFYLIIFSILGARLWYVLFSLPYYVTHLFEIIAIWNGGLAIHGGILAGLSYTIFYAKKKKFNFLILTDAIVPALLLGQALGRWGNFINQEAHGPETTYNFLKNTLHLPNFIVQGMNIAGSYYQPTFLYESLWNLFGLLLIIIIFRKIWKSNNGYLTAFYMIWYGFIRFFIEILRTDALMLFNIKIAQLTSFMMVICGIGLFIILLKKKT